ncbi:hypothetical protein PILCRDRAFT_828099 [Piloderma croceum F 1598]|uniref:non-specific serine/threonine protein kinase n=1 Tax=Piloderma croceum (strain F 1598) TaxID=765440 RepID=A0A0C3AKU6_PILCF|nr:hypothetical protein PILCRDRAFT_828099 [Piloderma croceum F 1598]
MPRIRSITALSLKLGSRLGYGSYAQVFKATEQESGKVVAVKKSRVSLRVERTILKHEGHILQFLQGHPSIPEVYAYGRFEHFEYLSMELLGKCLGDMDLESNELPRGKVFLIAKEILSALKHIHSRGIVHRDVKPDNIMVSLNDAPRFFLIDHGIARPYRAGMPRRYNPIEERRHIVGTLTWASLNAHSGYDLSRRDDLESLAYTLLFLLRGSLPWQRSSTESSTLLARMAQVREKKRAWTGSRLGEGYPDIFGQLLDYSRALVFDENPDYARFQAVFDDFLCLPLEHRFLAEPNMVSVGTPASYPISPKSAPCPVELGQLVYVQVLPRMTIEGYTARALDPSYWDDPSLSGEEWRTSIIPAIILQISQVENGARHIIKAIPLRRGPSSIDVAQDAVPLRVNDMSIPTDALSPLEDIYCYSFLRVDTFVCDPDQTDPVPTYWKITPDAAKSLLDQFDRLPPEIEDAEPSTDPDIRTDARMRKHLDYNLYAKLSFLQPNTLQHSLDGTEVNWESKRGWFDDLVKISKRRSADVGWKWTATNGEDQNDDDDDEFSNSYFELDIEEWDNRQQERDLSLTLGPEQNELLDQKIQTIVRIE